MEEINTRRENDMFSRFFFVKIEGNQINCIKTRTINRKVCVKRGRMKK